jgi:hypothetical protein
MPKDHLQRPDPRPATMPRSDPPLIGYSPVNGPDREAIKASPDIGQLCRALSLQCCRHLLSSFRILVVVGTRRVVVIAVIARGMTVIVVIARRAAVTVVLTRGLAVAVVIARRAAVTVVLTRGMAVVIARVRGPVVVPVPRRGSRDGVVIGLPVLITAVLAR